MPKINAFISAPLIARQLDNSEKRIRWQRFLRFDRESEIEQGSGPREGNEAHCPVGRVHGVGAKDSPGKKKKREERERENNFMKNITGIEEFLSPGHHGGVVFVVHVVCPHDQLVLRARLGEGPLHEQVGGEGQRVLLRVRVGALDLGEGVRGGGGASCLLWTWIWR